MRTYVARFGLFGHSDHSVDSTTSSTSSFGPVIVIRTPILMDLRADSHNHTGLRLKEIQKLIFVCLLSSGLVSKTGFTIYSSQRGYRRDLGCL
eukprot:COSAG05_NODE_1604_length_4427_cov_5.080869_6_plen_93_part_00